ncbi:hypothetical protein [Anaerotalea alkaliphila]|uniref:Uncharacterized protein n=1 Tax=Anaerotalea alkaliphila TaxID=2662126 RepID=A0A7X5KM88_9FIRM|nr:hypothetical protein [Anaerotalea alkaliphila]NDL67696.1 hypothetical protein [Anaerotalea alkaliphila]
MIIRLSEKEFKSMLEKEDLVKEEYDNEMDLQTTDVLSVNSNGDISQVTFFVISNFQYVLIKSLKSYEIYKKDLDQYQEYYDKYKSEAVI